MKTPRHGIKKLITATGASLLLVACSSSPTTPEGADTVRNKLNQLQANVSLAQHVPQAIQEAEIAVRAAEEPQKNADQGRHLVLMADRKVDLAQAQAENKLQEVQRQNSERNRMDAQRQATDQARRDASSARAETNIARMDTEAARQQSQDLQRQIDALNAKVTERGLVVTLGDVLFDTGMSTIRGGSADHLDQLSTFLNNYKDHTVVIEGHTDSTGNSTDNVALSQQRADSVMSYLVAHGVARTRLNTYGRGEHSPIADNTSDYGRQQNRRVEVIISNTVMSVR